MTVNELLQECKRLERAGYGERYVFISDDPDATDFHSLDCTFETDADELEFYWKNSNCIELQDVNSDEFVTLG